MDCGIYVESRKKVFDATKYVEERISKRRCILGRLEFFSLTVIYAGESRKIRTKRRTPIPAKTTFAGENT